jgi:hypothetical protein
MLTEMTGVGGRHVGLRYVAFTVKVWMTTGVSCFPTGFSIEASFILTLAHFHDNFTVQTSITRRALAVHVIMRVFLEEGF